MEIQGFFLLPRPLVYHMKIKFNKKLSFFKKR